jgi:uncharacterized membrane protein YbhN (UPF0104 family)
VNRRIWACARLAAAAAVLAVIVDRLGTGPFLSGLRSVSGWSLAAACAITVLTTAGCAWRWCLVARGLGVPVSFRTAVAAYYRSQFLNSALPGGILGDVHRGASSGREAGNLGRGLRAVAWERAAGQVVQASAAVLVLSLVPSPVGAAMPVVITSVGICATAGVLAVRRAARTGSTRRGRAARAVIADVREGIAAPERWPGVVGTSLLAVAGHAATFLVAARAAGVTAPLATLLPLTMLVLLAAAVPTNLGGWGPREGMAAWAFAGAGLGAAHGVAAATCYGALAAAATLPGAVVLVAGWLGRRSQPAEKEPSLAAGGSVRG